MFDNDLILNANPHTGVNMPVTVSRRAGNLSFWTAASLVNSTPLEFVVKHQEIKKGKDSYIRSMIGLSRRELVSTTGSGLVSNVWNLVNERPKDPSAISHLETATQLGQLLSVFGVSLYSSTTLTAGLLKFQNQEG